jgi:hypothetical protein
MAERRFAALASIRRMAEREEASADEPEVSPPAIAPAVAPHARPIATAPRSIGRPPGKRSDPAWKPRTILMRTKTHRRVSGLLLEQDDGPDLSELVDQLLTEWLAKR